MKSRPIICSTEMVKAILDGRKTQTRRVINRILGFGIISELHFVGHCWRFKPKNISDYVGLLSPDISKICPYGKIGDFLWVRETFGIDPYGKGVAYKATQKMDPDYPMKWKPSIFMPKKISRIALKNTDIRVERLQDISEEDAKAEGEPFGFPPDVAGCHTAIELFMSYWEPLNEKRGFGWDKNPYVWVIEFERIK